MTDAIPAAFRHDAHKFTGESHGDAREKFAGVRVNQSVHKGANGDAAALSQPQQTQEQTTTGCSCSPTRLPATWASSPGRPPKARCRTSSASRTRRRLTSAVVTAFNESVYHPDTSLKYHTMLVVALLDNYRTGNEFPDLRLIVDSTGKVVPFRTVFDGEELTLRDGFGLGFGELRLKPLGEQCQDAEKKE